MEQFGLGVENLVNERKDVFAEGSRGNRARGAREQAFPELLLQLGNAVGQSGLGYVALLRRQGERACPGNGLDITELAEIHINSL
jgi:hypothetical protein